jgi:L-fuconolactonase
MHKIDSHQHFWNFDPVRDAWITGDMFILQDNFLPADLAPILQHYKLDGCVAVQASQSEAESDFLLALAAQHKIVKGVVGWVDLVADDVDERLAYYAGFEKMKGFRHILQGETDRAYMLQPAFMRGIEKLSKYGFTYDILIHDDQLPYISEFVSAFPDQPFVIDHLAKPKIKTKEIDAWQKGIQTVAQHKNVLCKVSGMVTEADWGDWQRKDFTPYLDVVFDAFGAERLMYGSDWPVCRLAATYGEVINLLKAYCEKLTAEQQALFWGDNAVKFYKLKV